MGAFNIVSASANCPRCHQRVEVAVQFKYGDVWQHEYRIMDELKWGSTTDIGKPGLEHVVLDGEGESCPVCRYDGDWGFYVYIERDRIVEVQPADGRYDFVTSGSSYIVLKK